MAITLRMDDAQHAKLVQTIKDGFDNLVATLTGTTEQEQQAFMDQIAASLNLTADEVQAALKQFNQSKENKNGS